MDRHILHCKLKFDGQTPKLHHFGQTEPDGDRPDVFRRRSPVRKDVTRVKDAPALTEEERGDRLQVHLVGIWPAVLAVNRPPLLGKHADEVLLREVAYDHARTKLPLTLAGEV